MKDLYKSCEEMCSTLANELDECNDKVRNMRGKISAGDMEYIDRLTHALKSIKTIMAMLGAEYNNNYSNAGHMSWDYGYPRYDYSHASGNSMSSNMGMNHGYSRSKEDMIAELRRLMSEAPDEATRMKFQRLIDDMK